MSTMEQQIERVLRAAPRPAPPAGLKERLIAEVRLPATETPASLQTPASWLRRWWPFLVPASVSLACAVTLTMQQMEIRNLRQAIQDLARDSAAKANVTPAPIQGTNDVLSGPDAAARTQQEIARLKGLAGKLGTEVAQLEQMKAENAELRTQLAQPTVGSPTPEDADVLAKAREKAESIACVKNLKELRTGIKYWMGMNGNFTPPNILSLTNHNFTPQQVDAMWADQKAWMTSAVGIQVRANMARANMTPVDMLTMSNFIYLMRDRRYISRPLDLVCPSDKGHQAARDWASCTAANCSYSYLAPSAPATEPLQVLLLCPIHGHVALANGSVRSGVMKDHPEWLQRRDGKTYLAELPHPIQGMPGFPDRLEGIINYRPTPMQEPSTNPPPGGANP
jgi:hypothetical protein